MNSITSAAILISFLAPACIIIVGTGLFKALQLTTLSKKQKQRTLMVTGLGTAVWLFIIGLLAEQQLFAAPGLPPRPMFTVLIGLVILLFLSYTSTGKTVLRSTPLHWLIFFQTFRIGVELWFWYAYQADVFPKIMTFEGSNLDIISGVLAIIAGVVIHKQIRHTRIIATVYNIAGILILLNTLRAAALSMPSPIQQYAFDERLLLLGQPYFIYLPSVLVVLALGCHLLSLRQIALQTKAAHNNIPHMA